MSNADHLIATIIIVGAIVTFTLGTLIVGLCAAAAATRPVRTPRDPNAFHPLGDDR